MQIVNKRTDIILDNHYVLALLPVVSRLSYLFIQSIILSVRSLLLSVVNNLRM